MPSVSFPSLIEFVIVKNRLLDQSVGHWHVRSLEIGSGVNDQLKACHVIISEVFTYQIVPGTYTNRSSDNCMNLSLIWNAHYIKFTDLFKTNTALKIAMVWELLLCHW